MSFSMEDPYQGLADFKATIPDLKTKIDQQLAGVNLSGAGIDYTDSSNARIIGVYGGSAPGMTWAGAEVQVLYAYDQQSGESGVYFYTGGTLGPSIGTSGQTGIFLFNGPLDELPGLSFGVQGSAGISVGYTQTPSNYSMVQIGTELGISAEFTFGWTYGLKEVAKVDWQVTERSLQNIFSGNPDALAAILVELSRAKSLGGAWTDEFVEKYGDLIAYSPQSCFLAGTMIDMWPLDSSLRPDVNGLCDEAEVRAQILQKPIEEVEPKDWVISYDERGALVAGRVTRIFRNQAKHILDVFGLMVTPGHSTLCGDGKYAGRHVPIIDILRSDGALVRQDGSLVRASTSCPVDSFGDNFVQLAVGELDEDGNLHVHQQAKVRIGTRLITEDGQDISIADLLTHAQAVVDEAGYVMAPGMNAPTPLHIDFLTAIPEPEDYILRRSGLTLADIYQAAEWEDGARPKMPAPPRLDAGPVQPLSEEERCMMAPNQPLRFREEVLSEISGINSSAGCDMADADAVTERKRLH